MSWYGRRKQQLLNAHLVYLLNDSKYRMFKLTDSAVDHQGEPNKASGVLQPQEVFTTAHSREPSYQSHNWHAAEKPFP